MKLTTGRSRAEAFQRRVSSAKRVRSRRIYELRTARGLTQQQLAERIGTKQPVIARLEDADYQGHSLAMLYRIAAALGCSVSVEFVPRAVAAPRTRTLRFRSPGRIVARRTDSRQRRSGYGPPGTTGARHGQGQRCRESCYPPASAAASTAPPAGG